MSKWRPTCPNTHLLPVTNVAPKQQAGCGGHQHTKPQPKVTRTHLHLLYLPIPSLLVAGECRSHSINSVSCLGCDAAAKAPVSLPPVWHKAEAAYLQGSLSVCCQINLQTNNNKTSHTTTTQHQTKHSQTERNIALV